MNRNIENHPSIILQNEIADICKPLGKLNISYFAHINVKDNVFSAITNNPGFHRHYLYNKHYNADIHAAKEDDIKDYFIWDLVARRGRDLEMDLEAAAFGVRHVFTLIDAGQSGKNYYHFATGLQDASINYTYLANIDLLKMFISHFHHCVSTDKQLRQAHGIQFALDDETACFDYEMKSQNTGHVNRESFIRDLMHDKKMLLPNRKVLSVRQMQILYWLHQGKTISDIAMLLHVAEVTINKHLAEMKAKSNCYTQFQLGELFSRLMSDYPDLIVDN